MMYEYLKLRNNTEILHSHELEDGSIEVHFEKPTANGFKTARISIPSYEWIKVEGYTEHELEVIKEMVEFHEELIFKYARGEIKD